MTTPLIEAMKPVLGSLVAGGAHYAVNDTQPLPADGNGYALPYIVYLNVVSTDNVTLDGASGMQYYRIQVDIFAPRALAAQAIRIAVDAALASSFTTVPLSSQDMYEDPVKLHRVLREYSISYDESTT